MRHPRLVIVAFDDWLTNQLRELAHDHRWLIHEVRQLPAAVKIFREPPRPTVLLAQFDPRAQNVMASLRMMHEVRQVAPDTAIVAISDIKLPDEDRANWTATVLDLGSRLVLFPPLTRPVLEDAVGGLMSAILERDSPPDEVIDLAKEGFVS